MKTVGGFRKSRFGSCVTVVAAWPRAAMRAPTPILRNAAPVIPDLRASAGDANATAPARATNRI
jgi:hypothetical protein